MPAGISNYLRSQVLNEGFGGVGFGAASTLYCRLYNTLPNPDGTGGAEVSGNSYSPLAVANDATVWTVEAAGQKQNGNSALNFGSPTGSGWGSIVGCALWDASTAGNMYWVFRVTTAPPTASPAIPFLIPANGLIATMAPTA